jgi:hypothetical protein
MPIAFDRIPPAGNGLLEMLAAKLAGEQAGAEALLAASQPLVPVDTGALKISGRVERDGEGAAVIYTAVDEKSGYDYAAIQHQRTDYTHQQGQDHYLSDPMDQAHGQIVPALFGPVRKLLS